MGYKNIAEELFNLHFKSLYKTDAPIEFQQTDVYRLYLNKVKILRGYYDMFLMLEEQVLQKDLDNFNNYLDGILKIMIMLTDNFNVYESWKETIENKHLEIQKLTDNIKDILLKYLPVYVKQFSLQDWKKDVESVKQLSELTQSEMSKGKAAVEKTLADINGTFEKLQTDTIKFIEDSKNQAIAKIEHSLLNLKFSTTIKKYRNRTRRKWRTNIQIDHLFSEYNYIHNCFLCILLLQY